MATGNEDFDSVVEHLVAMFGDVINRDAIITIAESSNGDLNLSIDTIMKINESSATQTEKNTSKITVNEMKPEASPNIEVPQKSNECSENVLAPSYSAAMQVPQQASQSDPGPQQTTPSQDQSQDLLKDKLKRLGLSDLPNTHQIRQIINNNTCGSRILIIMRGLPGSGKSHLAKKLIDLLVGAKQSNYQTHIFSADDFFTRNGRYEFNKMYLSDAHRSCQDSAKIAMIKGLSPVIIDNTNVETWEMDFYVRCGVANGYLIEVLESKTPWAKKVQTLVNRNVHMVPYRSIKRMLDNFVSDITGVWLINHFNLTYPPRKTPPVLRSIPVFHSNNSEENEMIQMNTLDTARASSQSSQPSEDVNKNIHVNVINNNTEEIPFTIISPRIDPGQSMNFHRNDDEMEEESIDYENPFMEVQRRLDEIEKVENEWENGESWEEIKHEEVTTTQENIEVGPKPPRVTSPRQQVYSTVDENLINIVNNCNEWSDISMFLPPWENDKPNVEVLAENAKETQEAGTFTETGDYDYSKHKVISATSRDINVFYVPPQHEKIPEHRMFDKSTTTNELMSLSKSGRYKSEEFHFCVFRRMFRNVGVSDLKYIFDKCNGEVTWAVEIVLDGIANNELVVGDFEDIDDNWCICPNDDVTDSANVSEDIDETDNSNSIAVVSESATVITKKHSKRDFKPSDASLELKRQIEQNIFIAESHYSNHSLKLKRWRHGENPAEGEVEPVEDENQPSTSTSQNVTSNELAVVSSRDYEDQNSDDDSVGSVEELEKTVNINLGKEFIAELDALFGRSDMSYPESLMPKINIPLSLLNEINALWMESLMHQLDEHERQAAKMLQEDEEYARVLAKKEAELQKGVKQPEVIDFKEIMDMDYALSLYQKDVAGWKNKEPTDLAAKMTRDKLFNLFPEIPQDILAEMLMAHENDFQATVEVLLVSTGKEKILSEENGINNFVIQKEVERHQKALEDEKKALSEVEWPLLPSGEVPDMEAVNGYRDDADRHLKSRDLNIKKAGDYVRRGMLTVGSYYRQLAEFHKLKYEQSNSLAAASLMQIHASKCPDSATIDLHYLRVGEAKESLDLFIDTHIQKLKSRQGQGVRQHTLYFITGRGLHSNGRPRIKPAVKKRLRERGLECSEVNPGLLSAKVSAEHRLTHQVA